MYGNSKRTEYATYLLHQWMEEKVGATAHTGKTAAAQCRREAIKEHSNVKTEPRLFAAGEPRTPSSNVIRLPGIEHNLDSILKLVYKLYLRHMGASGA